MKINLKKGCLKKTTLKYILLKKNFKKILKIQKNQKTNKIKKIKNRKSNYV